MVDLPINERAWTYQELLLSKRTISFLPNRIEFRCREMCEANDGLEGVKEELGAESDVLNMVPSLPQELQGTLLHHTTLAGGFGAVLQEHWWNTVHYYSKRKLTFPHDKLPAIAAVASVFAARTGDVYLAGLWRTWFVEGLNWVALPVVDLGERPQRAIAQLPYRGPTWSWVSVTAAVANNYQTRSRWHTTARVLDVGVTLKTPNWPFGEVVEGYLELECKAKRLTPYQIWLYFLHKDERKDDDERTTIGNLHLDERVGYEWDWQWAVGTANPEADPSVTFAEICCESDTYRRGGLLLVSNNRGFERIGYVSITDELTSGLPLSARQTEIITKWSENYTIQQFSIY
jgi:hypothetical protein